MPEPRKDYRRVTYVVNRDRRYPALLRGKNDRNVAVLELLGSARDGEVVRDVPHDPVGETRNTWHYDFNDA
jgi:hypothetical protein